MLYQLVAADSPVQLEKFVNNELTHGWEVVGGVCSVVTESNEMLASPKHHFIQAMIRSGPEPKQPPI